MQNNKTEQDRTRQNKAEQGRTRMQNRSSRKKKEENKDHHCCQILKRTFTDICHNILYTVILSQILRHKYSGTQRRKGGGKNISELFNSYLCLFYSCFFDCCCSSVHFFSGFFHRSTTNFNNIHV